MNTTEFTAMVARMQPTANPQDSIDTVNMLIGMARDIKQPDVSLKPAMPVSASEPTPTVTVMKLSHDRH